MCVCVCVCVCVCACVCECECVCVCVCVCCVLCARAHDDMCTTCHIGIMTSYITSASTKGSTSLCSTIGLILATVILPGTVIYLNSLTTLGPKHG